MHQHASWLRTLRTTTCGLLLASGILLGQREAKSDEPTGKGDLNSIVADELRAEAMAEMKIRRALQQPTSIEFIETPLIDVIEFLEEQHDIQIELKTSALDTVGLGSDTPITRDLKGIALKSALILMLSDLELTYVIEEEVLQITTPEDAEQFEVTRVYNVGDLVDDKRPIVDLADAVTIGSVFGPHEPGAVVSFGDCLIVVANHARQNRIARLLALLRATKGDAELGHMRDPLGLYPVSDEPAVGSKARLRDERVENPKPTEIADPFGEGVPAPSKPKPIAKPAADPFGGGKDPFGGGGDKDPFGGNTDPPGVGGTDPFGKAADPFK